MDLELPALAQWLLLAAFLASRNSHTTDRRLFDAGLRSKKRKGQQSHRRQVRMVVPRSAMLHGSVLFGMMPAVFGATRGCILLPRIALLHAAMLFGMVPAESFSYSMLPGRNQIQHHAPGGEGWS